jgi:predicted amidohydrolase YtcJ
LLLAEYQQPDKSFTEIMSTSNISALISVTNASLWRWSDVDKDSQQGEVSDDMTLIVKDGVILDVVCRSSDQLKKYAFDRVIDAKNQLVIPGLNDAHIHVCMTGESRYFLNLQTCDNMDKLVSNLSVHEKKHPTLNWIQGVNWDQVGSY